MTIGIAVADASSNAGVYQEMDQLMESYVDGDLAAFDRLYSLLAPRVYRMLLHQLRSRHEADDLLQATFIRLHSARSGWIRGGRVLPYVLAIARNAVRDRQRSFSTKKILLTYSGEVPEMQAAEPPPNPAPWVSETLQQAVGELPPAYREAIELTKLQELSLRDAALVAGTTETGMKLRVHRAYKLLRTSLAHLAGELDDLT